MEGASGTQFDPEVVRVFLALEQERRVLGTLLEDITASMEGWNPHSGESSQCAAVS